VAWWPADGDATDQINGNNGTLEGGVTFAPGRIGQAFNMNGSTGYVLVPKSPLWAFGSNDFTIDLWANFNFVPTTPLGNPSAVFVSNDEGPGYRNKWLFSLDGGLTFNVGSPSIGSLYVVSAAFNPILHQWYHLAVTRSGSTFTLYINGVAVSSLANSVVIPTPNAPLSIGQAESAGFGQHFFMNGLLDEVEIYNRALSASEINNIFLAGSVGVKCTSSAAPSYTVIDLGTLPGGSFSYAHSINAAGHITGNAGAANGDTHPFLWTPGTGMIDIAGSAISPGGNEQGFWINASDQIVGSPGGGVSQQAFYYNGIFSYLSGALQSSAKGINDSGQIAGHILGAHAAVWPASTLSPLILTRLLLLLAAPRLVIATPISSAMGGWSPVTPEQSMDSFITSKQIQQCASRTLARRASPAALTILVK